MARNTSSDSCYAYVSLNRANNENKTRGYFRIKLRVVIYDRYYLIVLKMAGKKTVTELEWGIWCLQ